MLIYKQARLEVMSQSKALPEVWPALLILGIKNTIGRYHIMLTSRTDEAIIKTISGLESLYGDAINLQKTRAMLEFIFSNYEITEKSTALTVLDDMPEKIFLYLASKKIDGLSTLTLKSYALHLRRFSNSIRKNVADITANDIRIYLAHYAQTGVKDSTIASESDKLRGFFNWLEDEDYINKSPMRKIKPMKLPKRMRDALTKEELEILRTRCKNPTTKSIIRVFIQHRVPVGGNRECK